MSSVVTGAVGLVHPWALAPMKFWLLKPRHVYSEVGPAELNWIYSQVSGYRCAANISPAGNLVWQWSFFFFFLSSPFPKARLLLKSQILRSQMPVPDIWWHGTWYAFVSLLLHLLCLAEAGNLKTSTITKSWLVWFQRSFRIIVSKHPAFRAGVSKLCPGGLIQPTIKFYLTSSNLKYVVFYSLYRFLV